MLIKKKYNNIKFLFYPKLSIRNGKKVYLEIKTKNLMTSSMIKLKKLILENF